MNRAYRYRLYPDEKQATLLQRTFGCCRFLWNRMLDDKRKHYQDQKSMLYVTPASYKAEFPWLKEVDSLALANVQLHLEKAYRDFFRKKAGFPKFKSKKRGRRSYTTNRVGNNIVVMGHAIKLPKLGLVRAKIHRAAPENWELRSVTVSQDPCGDYYASVLYQYEADQPARTYETAIGLDYKSDGLYVDSNGKCAGMPKYFRQSAERLARQQRKLARKTGSRKGEMKSKNYQKQQKKANRIYRHVTNQRKDFLHKLSTAIAKQYDVVCVEDLDMKAMSNKGFRNGRSTMDNGWGMFLSILAYKLEERGKALVKISRWYPSSQICSCCGYQNPEVKDLSIREWTCPECGARHDRDWNAAVNILREGLRLLGLAY